MSNAERGSVMRLGATLAVTGALLSGPGHELTDTVAAGTPQPEWCGPAQLANPDAWPDNAGSFELPPLPTAYDRHVSELGRIVALGSVANTDGTSAFAQASGIPKLPAAYSCAFSYIADDPFIAATLKRQVGMNLFATDSATEYPVLFRGTAVEPGSGTTPEEALETDPGSVIVVFETGADKNTLFDTWGATHAIVVHEMAHAWARIAELRTLSEGGDPQLQRLIDRANRAYVAQTQPVLDHIRTQLGEVAEPELTRIQKELVGQGQPAEAAMVKTVLNALQGVVEADILTEIKCDARKTGLNTCTQQFITHMIEDVAARQGHQLSPAAWDLLDSRRNPAIKALNKQHVLLLENELLFPMSDNSSALGLTGGHPYSSANEMFADEIAISNVLGAPETAARIDALPQAQRQLTINSYLAAADLCAYIFSPEAKEATAITQVAARLRALK